MVGPRAHLSSSLQGANHLTETLSFPVPVAEDRVDNVPRLAYHRAQLSRVWEEE